MARKETRRNASLKLAIALLLLAISQAFAPPFHGGRFWHQPGEGTHTPKVVVEAAKHDWLHRRRGNPGAKSHEAVSRHDCLRWRLKLKAHCPTAIGLAAGIHDPNADDNAGQGSNSGGDQGSGSGGYGDSGLAGFFVLAEFVGGSGGGGSGGSGSAGGSGGDGSGGASGGGSGGGGSAGGSGGDGSGGASGGGSGGDGSAGGSGGDGSGGGGAGGGGSSGQSGRDGSGGASGGAEPGDGGVAGCGLDNPSACIPGDSSGTDSGCSLNNPGACAADGGETGNEGNSDCLDVAACGEILAVPSVNTPVPEPSTVWLMGAGMAALIVRRRRRGVAADAWRL